MAQSKVKTSLKSKKQAFITVIKLGKPQGFLPYIAGIKQIDSDIQTIVAQVLSQILVQKKLPNPTWYLHALNFYKELFKSASIDYITDNQCFPQQVHQQIVKICKYRPQIANTQQRGKQYFIQICKFQKTQQNGKALQKIGCSYVELALEILQSFAQWFPMDYFEPKNPSFFSQQYQKLITERISFPKKQEYQFIKESDFQSFRTNYASFIDSLQDDENPKKEPQQKIISSNISKNETNGPNMIKLKDKELLTSKRPVVPQQKKERNDPSMIVTDKSLLKTNQDHKTTKNNPTLDVKRSQNPKEVVSKIAGQVDSSIRKTSGFPQDKPQTFNRSFSQSEEQLPKNPSKKQEKKKNQVDKNVKEKIEQKSKSNRVEKNDIKSDPSRLPSNKIEQKKPIQQNNTLNIPVLQTDFNIPSSKIQVANSKKVQQPSVSFSFAQSKPNSAQIKPQDINDSKFKRSSQIIAPYSFNEKSIKKSNEQEEVIKKPIRDQTPRKIPKIQKPSLTSSPSQQYPTYTNRTYQNDKKSTNLNQRPRSMPKTQRRQNNTKIEFYNNFSYTKPDQFFSRNASPSKQFNKTLSYWANNRSKNPMSRQLQKASSIAQALNDMRLDQTYLPFEPKYFEPVTLQMHTLRSQSLNLLNSGRSHDIFYSNRIISCRLIKDMKNIFTLIVHNITNDTIEIDYQQMKNVQYCKKIKILSWGNRIEIGRYALPKNGYMDIKFKFQTKDFNFRFLPFLIKIDQRIEKIMLPITLIDMCSIQKINPFQLNRFSLKGSIINSQPYTLHEKELPMFLSGFKFPSLQTSRERKEKQVIIGTCSMTMQKMDQDGEGQVFINVIVRVTNWEERKIQISIMYEKKNEDCENFAKVIMYHLKFLTKEPQK